MNDSVQLDSDFEDSQKTLIPSGEPLQFAEADSLVCPLVWCRSVFNVYKLTVY